MTIAEFLLARIAEGELNDWQTCPECGCSDAHCKRHASAGFIKCCPDCRHPARVLAECEAKRRIVERHGVPPPSSMTSAQAQFSQSSCKDLCDLASVYVDHPDFDPAWLT